MESKILVTGGAGYIGSHTVIKLIENEFELVILDNLSNSKLEILNKITELTHKKFDFVEGDITDRNVLKKIFKNNSISAVIHFAGLKSVGEAEKYPMKYYENNVLGSLILFQEMALSGVKKIVFSSSATVYGEHFKNQFDENTPTNPINVYGKTKLIIENMLRDIRSSDKDWNIALLRYFNPVGAHPSGLIGENPCDIPNNLMPYISQVAGGLREKLYIFGDDYPTPDGTGKRDYIHVEDLSQAHLQSLYHLLKNKDQLLILNLGTGKSHSVLEMVKAFEKASGKNIPYKIVERRVGDIAEFFADPSKAKEIINWEANLDINNMCEDAWRWQKNIKNFSF